MKSTNYDFFDILLIASEAHSFKNFKTMTRHYVLNICLDKGYLTKRSIENKSKEYLFVINIFERDYPSMILMAPTIKPIVKPEDYLRVRNESEEFATAIVEDVGKSLMNKEIELPF